MKLLAPFAAVLALASLAAPAAAVDVGVSIRVAEPGAYGRVDIGRFPAPALVAPKPIVAPLPVIVGAPRPVVVAPADPVYLWVPSVHRARWSHYCGRYQACGRPVYFVDDRWYHEKVMIHRVPPGHAKRIVHVEARPAKHEHAERHGEHGKHHD